MPTFDIATTSTRLPHIADLIAAYDDGEGATADIDISVDITGIKASLITYLNEQINTLLITYAADNEVKSDLNDLRNTMLAYLNNNIANTVDHTVTVDTDVKAGLQQAMADFRTAIAEELPVTDGRCSGEGRYSLSQDTGNPADTRLIHCKTCDGFGSVAEASAAMPTIIWPEKQLS